MRRITAVVLASAVVLGSLGAPAGARARKRIKVHDSFAAQALPFVNLAATGTENRSCFAGVEGVHKVSHPFEAPGKGTLEATMEGFTGDWDLAIADADGRVLVYSLGDQLAGQEAAEESVALPLKKGQTVNIVACNYLAAPQAEVHFRGTFVK